MIIKGNLKKYIINFSKIITIINKYIPKNKNTIVFYSNLGFRDNVKALYDYIISEKFNAKYKIICSTNDYKNFKNLKVKNVKFVSNFRGVFYFLTSKYFFYCFGKYPIKPSNKQIVVNLWHGTPLKKIGNLIEEEKNTDYNFFTHLLVTSEKFKDIMMKAFNCREDNIIICGQPRNDTLFENKHKSDKKIIFWLPTFRKTDILEKSNINSNNIIPLVNSKEELLKLDNKLKEMNANLLIKIHPLQKVEYIDLQYIDNIKILNNQQLIKENQDLYQILSYTDILITDYSSVYFDYLLLDKPIIFTVDDIEQYKNDRGFVFENFYDYMPGYKVKKFNELMESLDDILVKGIDIYIDERSKINEFSNKYKEGNFRKLLLEILDIKK